MLAWWSWSVTSNGSGAGVKVPGARPRIKSGCALERTRDVLHTEAFDRVARTDVLVVLEGHAALLADMHFGDFVLEALEGLELAFVDDDVVAHQADPDATLDLAFGNA